MTSYVGLLRGVNLGRRQLEMDDLKRVAARLGYENVSTYIASGNLLFSSDRTESTVKSEIERAVGELMGVAVPVMVRTAAEMRDVVDANPFAEQPGNRVVAIFLDKAPPKDPAKDAQNAVDERIARGEREVYVHYPNGQGASRLAIPAAKSGTARNMNTVAKLAELAKGVR